MTRIIQQAQTHSKRFNDWLVPLLPSLVQTVLLGWLFLAATIMIDRITPLSEYIQINSIVVSDTYSDESILVTTDRKVLRPITATKSVEVERFSPSRSLFVAQSNCSSQRERFFHPQSADPDPMTLGYFLGTERCKLGIGRYRLAIKWVFHTPGGERRKVYLTRTFRVIPRP